MYFSRDIKSPPNVHCKLIKFFGFSVLSQSKIQCNVYNRCNLCWLVRSRNLYNSVSV